MLRDDELGDARRVLRAGRVRMLLLPLLARGVHVLAVDEHHDIGVLLDGTGLPEVGEHRDVRSTGLDGARELGGGQHRHAELARKLLQTS